MRYPTLWQFACVFSRASMELKKRFCTDLWFSYTQKPCGRVKDLKYNDQTGIVHILNLNIPLDYGVEREILLKNLHGIYRFLNQQIYSKICIKKLVTTAKTNTNLIA